MAASVENVSLKDAPFQGQCALVTGASGGIGEALAREFAARGAKLVLVARNEEKLHAIAESLPTPAMVVATDLESGEGVDELFRAVYQRRMAVDHVVNNAGFGMSGALATMDEAGLNGQLQLNVVAVTRLTRHFLPAMLERRRGGFLHVASVIGFTPTPYMTAYAATKAFVISFNAGLAGELTGTGVSTTALCPGAVQTGFQARAGYALGKMEAISRLPAEAVARVGVNAYSKGRLCVAPGAANSVIAGLSAWVSPNVSASVSGAVVRLMGRHKAG